MGKKGWIALDIDGTITSDKYSVPAEVVQYLGELQASGWEIALATGRAFAFASLAVAKIKFPFFLLAQNGSVALKMPQRELVFKKYLSYPAISSVEEAYQGVSADFLVYSGYDKGDCFYWRASRFSPDDLLYVEELKKREKEQGVAVEVFDPVQLASFPLIKCFGLRERMEGVAKRLRAKSNFQVAHIRDMFYENYEILLVTDSAASKGLSLQELFLKMGRGDKVIAAGDDENDLSLLQAADVKIAMPQAPESLKKIADLIAPPVKELGILAALKSVLK